MADKKILTAARLREMIDYNPETGKFNWKKIGWIQTNKQTGYKSFHIAVDNNSYIASSLAWLWMTGEWAPSIIHHKNLNSLDNRWNNLMLSDSSHNRIYAPLRRDNKTGAAGLQWEESSQRWRVVFGKKHIGRYRTKEEAMRIAAQLRKG